MKLIFYLTREKGGMKPRQATISICQGNTAHRQRVCTTFLTLNLHIRSLPAAWQELEGTFSPSGWQLQPPLSSPVLYHNESDDNWHQWSGLGPFWTCFFLLLSQMTMCMHYKRTVHPTVMSHYVSESVSVIICSVKLGEQLLWAPVALSVKWG